MTLEVNTMEGPIILPSADDPIIEYLENPNRSLPNPKPKPFLKIMVLDWKYFTMFTCKTMLTSRCVSFYETIEASSKLCIRFLSNLCKNTLTQFLAEIYFLLQMIVL